METFSIGLAPAVQTVGMNIPVTGIRDTIFATRFGPAIVAAVTKHLMTVGGYQIQCGIIAAVSLFNAPLERPIVTVVAWSPI